MSRLSHRSCCHSHYDNDSCDPEATGNAGLVTGRVRQECRAKARRKGLFVPDHFAAFRNRLRHLYVWYGVVALVAALAFPIFAQDALPSGTLKNAVVLMGSSITNEAMSMPLPPGGLLSLDLYLQVEKPLPGVQQGQLMVTNFQAQTSPAEVIATAMQIDGGSGGFAGGAPLSVALAGPALLHLRLTGKEHLRPGTTYKGWLFLTAGGQANRWEITLTTGGRGILAAAPIGTMKFDPWPWQGVGRFSVSLWDKSEGGPYHNVRARFEPSAAPASKMITSNFSIDTFSFYEGEQGNLQRVDLEQRARKVPGETKTHQPRELQSAGQPRQKEGSQSHELSERPQQVPLPEEGQHLTKTVDLDRQGQRTFIVAMAPLSPGEYAGALRFVSNESSDDTPDAKLPLTIQVRHFWLVPVIVILIGSLLGWYTSKYAVYVRKARELSRQVRNLRARGDDLARSDPPRTGWEFSSEATSFGLARVRVMLSQLALLTSRALLLLAREEEIQLQRSDAEQRLSALELLRATRLRVQPFADGRPAAQLALGRLLRLASSLLDRPTFDQTQQAEFKTLLQNADVWQVPEARNAKYREALLDRLQSQDVPELSQVQGLPVGKVKEQLEALLGECPRDKQIPPGTTHDELSIYDQKIAKIALLWRERKTDWAEPLANKCEEKVSVEALFRFVDEQFWESLQQVTGAGQLKLEQYSTGQGSVKTYDLVEVSLKSKSDHVTADRILKHPLRVVWTIVAPGGNVRTTEGDGVRLIQYFPEIGNVTVTADLQWGNHQISIKGEVHLNVLKNEEYGWRKILKGWPTEVVVFVIAAGFATATAMVTQYDATFGSISQYLALLLWAAGAGAGGNVFKQLGTTSTPGGQSEATLPAAAPGGSVRAT